MSKYVYYDGKIYTKITNVYNQTLYCHKNDIHHFFDVKELCGDYVEFDRFEDLIEIGDIAEINNFNNYEASININRLKSIRTMKSGRKEYQFDNSSIGDSDMFEKYIVSIYKHIGKNFIRVCHKENEKWVID